MHRHRIVRRAARRAAPCGGAERAALRAPSNGRAPRSLGRYSGEEMALSSIAPLYHTTYNTSETYSALPSPGTPDVHPALARDRGARAQVLVITASPSQHLLADPPKPQRTSPAEPAWCPRAHHRWGCVNKQYSTTNFPRQRCRNPPQERWPQGSGSAHARGDAVDQLALDLLAAHLGSRRLSQGLG